MRGGAGCGHVLSCSVHVLLFVTPLDCSPPGSSVHGSLQARILECVAMPSSRGSSHPRGQTHVSFVFSTGRQILYHCTTWEALPLEPLKDSPGEPGMTNKGGSPGTMLRASSLGYKGKKNRKPCKESPGR